MVATTAFVSKRSNIPRLPDPSRSFPTPREAFVAYAIDISRDSSRFPRLPSMGSRNRDSLRERRQLLDLGVPGLELGMARTPRLVGVAEVEIAQRAADGDLADGLEIAEAARLILELGERALHLALLQLDITLASIVLPQRDLAAARLRRVEDAVAQRHLGDRLPARRAGRGEELGRAADTVQILADHRAVVEPRAVVEDQGRHLGERIELEQCGIGRADLPPLDLVV